MIIGTCIPIFLNYSPTQDAIAVFGRDGVEDALSVISGGEFFYSSELTKVFGEFGCTFDTNTDLVDVCGNVLFLISGYDHNNLNEVS